jgi:hypothetical protein
MRACWKNLGNRSAIQISSPSIIHPITLTSGLSHAWHSWQTSQPTELDDMRIVPDLECGNSAILCLESTDVASQSGIGAQGRTEEYGSRTIP